MRVRRKATRTAARTTARNAARSIATRWFVNSFSFVAGLLAVIDVSVFFFLQNYYYTAVEQYLLTEANIIHGVLSYTDEYGAEMRRTVEEFERKSRMELMVIAWDGRVDMTSSGFSPQSSYDMPDYELAKTSLSVGGDGIGRHIGILANNERYMGVTVMLSGQSQPLRSGFSAIRVVSSLDRVDGQIYSTALLLGGLSIGVLLLLLFLGMYFIKSIVSPLKQISFTAQRLAKGDFSQRIGIPKNTDEISDLCGIFNNMADELENSENIKNEFISSVSHELRTPLTAIKGWSETILETGDDAVTREKGLKVIISETGRLSGMVEELLDFSRIQSGKFKLQKTNMDVFAELADALLIYTEKAHREGISVSFDEPREVAAVYGDKNRIRQVFINIIDNAIKYSGEGGTIAVSGGITETAAEIRISDTGRGISEADLPKVKNKFFKADSSVRGSGIGLAVADEIISMHGGELLIDSKLGAGTAVTVILPLLRT